MASAEQLVVKSGSKTPYSRRIADHFTKSHALSLGDWLVLGMYFYPVSVCVTTYSSRIVTSTHCVVRARGQKDLQTGHSCSHALHTCLCIHLAVDSNCEAGPACMESDAVGSKSGTLHMAPTCIPAERPPGTTPRVFGIHAA